MSTIRLARAALLCFLATLTAVAQTKLLRFPDIHGDKVVFTYGGDLWTASASGGTATRLTAHPGVELFAKFSPDGKWIAFTGQYDGDEQVYVMPADRRRAAAVDVLSGPRAAGAALGLRQPGLRLDQRRQARHLPLHARCLGERRRRISTRSPWMAAPPSRCPCRNPARARILPAATKIVYSPRVPRLPHREALQRRRGERAVHLRPGHARRQEDQRSPRASRDPMWIGDKIYFDSDRDGHFNLYVVRHARRQDRAGHHQQTVGHPLAQHRPQGPHRLRTERRASGPRYQERQEHADLHHRSRRWRGAPAQPRSPRPT